MSYQSKYTGSEIDAGIDAAKAALPKNGGTMLGELILAGNTADDYGAVTKKYVDDAVKNIELTPGENGEDGVSVTHSWNGTVLSVTSASGTSSADLKGEKGDTGAVGQTGADGFSPTVSIATISGGHRVSITDANSTQSFNVMDGKDGSSGGSGGTGVDGEDGATFTPSVSSDGVLSWTNDKGLTNPAPVNIKGPQGPQGEPGKDGADATADKMTIVNMIYPVGSIYMSVNAASPATLFGGTWERIKDTFLLSAGDTYAAGDTGGEAEHTLTVAEIPSHSHHVRTQGSETAQNALTYTSQKSRLAGAGTLVQNAGGGQPHNNMPPYLAVYMWKRTE